jgi:hypothetical protein
MKTDNFRSPQLIFSIYLLGLILFVSLISLLTVRRVADTDQPVFEKEVWVYGSQKVTQTIVPHHNGFNLAMIYLRNVALRNDLPFTFSLLDSAGKEIRSIPVNGTNIGDGTYIKFQFPPIPDSMGRTYTIVLSAPGSDLSRAIGVGFTSGNVYPEGSAIAGNETGDIAFQLFYRPVSAVSAFVDTLKLFLQHLFRPIYIIQLLVLGIVSVKCIRSLRF